MHSTQKACIFVGLQYGDEGKGTMTDYACRRGAKLVVRYNGGAQAAHNVVLADGRQHTFSQFGSGAFVPGVRTLLSKHMLWNPLTLVNEHATLSPKLGEYALALHYIDCRAPVTTPYHIAANRLKEWFRGKGRHGSCGMGIGETAFDLVNFSDEVVRAMDLTAKNGASALVAKLARIQERKRAELLQQEGSDLRSVPEGYLKDAVTCLSDPRDPAALADAYRKMALSQNGFNIVGENVVKVMLNEGSVVFEGAQGVLLDEWHGFHPYTTWSNTLATNALEILEEVAFAGEVEVVGIARSYMTRHGAGPFVSEGGLRSEQFPDEHNTANVWQDSFRFGGFDEVALRYAVECLSMSCGLSSIALTHLDVFDRGIRVPRCKRYMCPVTGGQELVERIIPAFDRDLSYQEGLTHKLTQTMPVWGEKLTSAEEVIEWVEHGLYVPVKYRSYGPTSEHKQCFERALV